MFLFELLWSSRRQFIIAKGYQWQLYTEVQVHKYIVLSNVISTTITKGLAEQIKVYACTSKTKISVKDKRQLQLLAQDNDGQFAAMVAPSMVSQVADGSHDPSQVTEQEEQTNDHSSTSYQGKVTTIIDENAGIYELDGNIRLYMTYLNKDVGCTIPKIVSGCYATIYNAHFKKLLKVPSLVCCMRSYVEVLPVHSPLVTSSLDGCLVKLVTQFNPGFSMLTRLQEMVKQLQVKLPTKFHRKLSKIIVSLLESRTEGGLVPRKRNIYAEFLNSPHQSCVVDDVKEYEHHFHKPFTLPSIADLKKEITHRFNQSKSLDEKHYKCCVSASTTTSSNPMILVAILSSNAETGSLSLYDETGTIDCIATSLQPEEHPSHICKTNTTCHQRKDQPLHTPYSYACPYAHIWNLNGLVKVTEFFMVHEQFIGEDDGHEPDAARARSYIVFDMRHVVYIYSQQDLKVTTVCVPHSTKGTSNSSQSHILTIKVLKKGNLVRTLRKTDRSMSFTLDAIIIPEESMNITALPSNAATTSSVTLDSKSRTRRNIVLRFEGRAVKWYPVLYTGSCYRVIKHQRVDGDGDVLARLSNHGTLTVSEHDVIEQHLCTLDQAMMKDTDKVHSVEDIISGFKLSRNIVSFIGMVASCDTYKAHQPTQPGTVHMNIRVVDTKAVACADVMQSLSVFIKCHVIQYPFGILPQALICVRGVEVDVYKGRLRCQSGPLTSVQILHMPNCITECNLFDKQVVVAEAPTRYAIHIINSLLSGTKENHFIIKGYISALYSLDIRWVCYTCRSHNRCRCSSQSDANGYMTVKARLLIDDATSVVNVWCSESKSIAYVLDLSDHRWQQILDVIQTDGPFHFNLFNDVIDKNNNVLNLLEQLCRSSMIQRPVQLHCSSAYLRATEANSAVQQLWVRSTHGFGPQ